MTLQFPSQLDWLVKLTAGQSWPKGDEDRLRALGRAWSAFANDVDGAEGAVEPLVQKVLANLSGRPAEEFQRFADQMRQQMPALAQAGKQVAKMSEKTAQEVEYAKYMIIGQLVILAAEIAWCVANAVETFGASEALIPGLIAAARMSVQMILRRLAMAVATGAAMMVGLDVVVQAIQAIKAKLSGDDFSWNWSATAAAAANGAIAGGLAGITHIGLNKFATHGFGDSLGGRVVNAGVTGAGITVISNAAFGGDNSVGLGAAAGIVGGIAGGGGRRGHIAGGDEHLGPIAVGRVDSPDIGDTTGDTTADTTAGTAGDTGAGSTVGDIGRGTSTESDEVTGGPGRITTVRPGPDETSRGGGTDTNLPPGTGERDGDVGGGGPDGPTPSESGGDPGNVTAGTTDRGSGPTTVRDGDRSSPDGGHRGFAELDGPPPAAHGPDGDAAPTPVTASGRSRESGQSGLSDASGNGDPRAQAPSQNTGSSTRDSVPAESSGPARPHNTGPLPAVHSEAGPPAHGPGLTPSRSDSTGQGTHADGTSPAPHDTAKGPSAYRDAQPASPQHAHDVTAQRPRLPEDTGQHPAPGTENVSREENLLRDNTPSHTASHHETTPVVPGGPRVEGGANTSHPQAGPSGGDRSGDTPPKVRTVAPPVPSARGGRPIETTSSSGEGRSLTTSSPGPAAVHTSADTREMSGQSTPTTADGPAHVRETSADRGSSRAASGLPGLDGHEHAEPGSRPDAEPADEPISRGDAAGSVLGAFEEQRRLLGSFGVRGDHGDGSSGVFGSSRQVPSSDRARLLDEVRRDQRAVGAEVDRIRGQVHGMRSGLQQAESAVWQQREVVRQAQAAASARRRELRSAEHHERRVYDSTARLPRSAVRGTEKLRQRQAGDAVDRAERSATQAEDQVRRAERHLAGLEHQVRSARHALDQQEHRLRDAEAELDRMGARAAELSRPEVMWRERFPAHSLEPIQFMRENYPQLRGLNSAQYHAGNPAHMFNCVNVAVSTAETLAGRPMVPHPSHRGRSGDLLTQHYGRPHQLVSTPDEIVNMLVREGPGAQGIVFEHGNSGDGHVFNAVYDARLHSVVFLDAQDGRLASFSPHRRYGFMLVNGSSQHSPGHVPMDLDHAPPRYGGTRASGDAAAPTGVHGAEHDESAFGVRGGEHHTGGGPGRKRGREDDSVADVPTAKRARDTGNNTDDTGDGIRSVGEHGGQPTRRAATGPVSETRRVQHENTPPHDHESPSPQHSSPQRFAAAASNGAPHPSAAAGERAEEEIPPTIASHPEQSPAAAHQDEALPDDAAASSGPSRSIVVERSGPAEVPPAPQAVVLPHDLRAADLMPHVRRAITDLTKDLSDEERKAEQPTEARVLEIYGGELTDRDRREPLPRLAETIAEFHLHGGKVEMRGGVNYRMVRWEDHHRVTESHPGEILWHFTSASPHRLFEEGLIARDPRRIEWIADRYTRRTGSQFVSTTRDRELWYRGQRYRWEIHSGRNYDQTGIDIDRSAWPRGYHEVAFSESIEPRALASVYDRARNETGYWNRRRHRIDWYPGDRQSSVAGPPPVQMVPAPQLPAVMVVPYGNVHVSRRRR